jgi:hypothetical protein
MTNTKTGTTTCTADYLFYNLSDCVLEGEKVVALVDGQQKVATCTVHDFPPALSLSQKSSLRFKLRDDMWDDQERIYLVRTGRSKQKDLLRHGVQCDESGPYIERKGKASVEMLMSYLPSMAHTPLVGHAIPATSWGANLHRLLTAEYWQALRDETFYACNNRCEICGARGALECHELWEYHEPVADTAGNIGVQELKRLMSLCSACHEAHHLGFANLRGQLDRALGRIAHINRWNKEQLDQYYAYITDTWNRRSSYHWMLDLGFLPGAPTIALKKRWTTIEHRFITTQTGTGETVTKLLGACWQAANSSETYLTRIGIEGLRNVPVQA